MNRRFQQPLVWLLAMLMICPWPLRLNAQSAAAAFKPEEIEQLVAPIALYPDSLVSQILMASTYPLEVVQADRWVKANTSLKGDALTAALEKQTWDPSIKSLVNFPQVLAMMNEKLDLTQRLGDAFLAQQKEVLDAVQRLRAKAKAEGKYQGRPVSIDADAILAAHRAGDKPQHIAKRFNVARSSVYRIIGAAPVAAV